MKIVLLVDYSNKEFNKDFMLSNSLIARGHNVFLAVTDNQFAELIAKCDRAYLGMSAIHKSSEYANLTIISENIDI